MDLSTIFTANLEMLSGHLLTAYALAACGLLGLFFFCELGRGLGRQLFRRRGDQAV